MDTEGRVTVLAVVIAGVIALMVEKGPYTWGNTVFGLTLLTILVAYGVPRDRERAMGVNERPPTKKFLVLERAAFGAALALCIMNIMGPILEVSLINWWSSPDARVMLRRVMLRDLPFLLIWGGLAWGGYLLVPRLSNLVHKHPTPDNTDRPERG